MLSISCLDALLADLQNSSRGSGNRKPSDDFPPPPASGITNSHNDSYTYKPPPPQTLPKPEPVKNQIINNNESDSNLSQKSFNNLSELEGLLQDLDRASDTYHQKSFAQSQLNIAQTPSPPQAQNEGIKSLTHKKMTQLKHQLNTTHNL